MNENDNTQCLIFLLNQYVKLKERIESLEKENKMLRNKNRYLYEEKMYQKWLNKKED